MTVLMRKHLYRVNLVFHNGMTRSVFIRAKNRQQAERRAMKRYPRATHTDRSPFSQVRKVI